jgi:V8-like Glu-specific endopeptidase
MRNKVVRSNGSLFISKIIITLGFVFMGMTAQAEVNVIYGQDDRLDMYQVTDAMHRELADSTVVLMRRSSIQQNASGELAISAPRWGTARNMCSNERFADQPSGGFCSGSLIAPNIMLTAGHCITSESACASTSFVFGYAVNREGLYPRTTVSNQVYNCASIIRREQVGSGADYALIRLDRAVQNHASLRIANRTTQMEAPNGTGLIMIGHPAGLPTKVEAGGRIRSNSPSGFFVATTDSYGGNSGSAVFNAVTGEIEGVLVRGEQDYVSTSAGCSVSKVCAEGACRGEDVTKVSAFLPFFRTIEQQEQGLASN